MSENSLIMIFIRKLVEKCIHHHYGCYELFNPFPPRVSIWHRSAKILILI